MTFTITALKMMKQESAEKQLTRPHHGGSRSLVFMDDVMIGAAERSGLEAHIQKDSERNEPKHDTPALNWIRTPASFWIFLIISPFLPITMPTANLGTGT